MKPPNTGRPDAAPSGTKPPFRVLLHLDMDAFYASVEQRDQPHLAGLPVIVGAPPDRRGVVCAASYEARRFGVRSAMPSVTAGRLCPHGTFLPPRFDTYRTESAAIIEILRAHAGSRIQQVSIDEAYADVSAFCQGADHDASLGLAVPIAGRIRAAIRSERRLTATVGIASNKLLAKLASDHHKPDGLTVIAESTKAAFLRPLPVRVLHGVGRVTEEGLRTAGIETIGHLQDHSGDLRALVGSWAAQLREFAFGIDNRPIECHDGVKSISSENTFSTDTLDRAPLRACLREQAADIASKLQQRRLAAHTIQVKVRYGDFTTLTRQFSLEEPVSDARDLYRLACWLLARDRLVHRPLRLLGIGASTLREAPPRQLLLAFDPPRPD